MLYVTVLFHFACKLSTHTQYRRRPDISLYLGLVLLLHVASFYLESTSDDRTPFCLLSYCLYYETMHNK